MPVSSPRRRGALVALALAASGVLVVPAAEAAAPAAPTCGSTVTADTTLTADLTCAGNGLTLAPGVRLDLGGHTLAGNGTSTGLSVSDAGADDETAVTHGEVTNFATGLSHVGTSPFEDIAHLSLDGVRFASAPVRLENTDAEIVSSRFYRSDLRLYQVRVHALRSVLNRSSATGEMLLDLDLDHSRVIGGVWSNDENAQVTIRDSVLTGLPGGAPQPTRCLATTRILDSVIRDYRRPIDASCGLFSMVRTEVSGFRGRALVASGDTLIEDSVFTDNGSTPVSASGEVTVVGNRFEDNDGHGLAITGADAFAVLTGNTFADNSGDGLRVLDTFGARVGANTATGNDGVGLRAVGATDLGHNRASGNGGAQCVGVTCTAP